MEYFRNILFILRRYVGCYTYKHSAKSLIWSEFQYVAILKNVEKINHIKDLKNIYFA